MGKVVKTSKQSHSHKIGCTRHIEGLKKPIKTKMAVIITVRPTLFGAVELVRSVETIGDRIAPEYLGDAGFVVRAWKVIVFALVVRT